MKKNENFNYLIEIRYDLRIGICSFDRFISSNCSASLICFLSFFSLPTNFFIYIFIVSLTISHFFLFLNIFLVLTSWLILFLFFTPFLSFIFPFHPIFFHICIQRLLKQKKASLVPSLLFLNRQPATVLCSILMVRYLVNNHKRII